MQFAERHDVELEPGSAFAEWAGGTKAKVNSLHGQGIKRLGKNLVAEAFAPDGLVEGVRVDGSPAFAYGVQWHPEWHHESIPFYQRTLEAFAAACMRAPQAPRGGCCMSLAHVPCIWVVASHRRSATSTAKPQMYTVMDEGGQRTLLNMGLQPMTYPRVPAERMPALLDGVDGILLGGSRHTCTRACTGSRKTRTSASYDPDRDAVAQPLIRAGDRARRAGARRLPRRARHQRRAGRSLHQWLRGAAAC